MARPRSMHTFQHTQIVHTLCLLTGWLPLEKFLTFPDRVASSQPQSQNRHPIRSSFLSTLITCTDATLEPFCTCTELEENYFFSFIFILYLINHGAEGQIPCWCVQTNKGDSYTIMNCLFLFIGCKKLRLPPISDGKLPT